MPASSDTPPPPWLILGDTFERPVVFDEDFYSYASPSWWIRVFEITLSEGQTVTLNSRSSSSKDYVQIFSPSLEMVTSGFTFESDRWKYTATFTAEESGTYFIRPLTNSHGSSFYLNLENLDSGSTATDRFSDIPGDITTTETLLPGVRNFGLIDPSNPTDLDTFKLETTPGRDFRLFVESNRTGSLNKAKVAEFFYIETLDDGTKNRVDVPFDPLSRYSTGKYPDYYNPGRNSDVFFDFTAEGNREYYATIGKLETTGSGGTYSVALYDLEDDHPNTSDNPNIEAWEDTETLKGKIDYLGDRDFVSFQAKEGTIYKFKDYSNVNFNLSDVTTYDRGSNSRIYYADETKKVQIRITSTTDHANPIEYEFTPEILDKDIFLSARSNIIYISEIQWRKNNYEIGTDKDDIFIPLTNNKETYQFSTTGADRYKGTDNTDILISDFTNHIDDLDRGASITRAYALLLDRTPDALGYQYAVTKNFYISTYIIQSPEFSQKWGAMSGVEWVDFLYTRLRGAEGGGSDPEYRALRAEVEANPQKYFPRQLVEKVLGSEELRQKTLGSELEYVIRNNDAASSDEAFGLYAATLGRTPDKAGFLDHVMDLGDGRDLVEVAKLFIGSPEFLQKGTLSDRAFAETILTGLKGAAPTSAEIDVGEAFLSSGVGRAEYVAAMVTAFDAAGLTEWMRAQGTDDTFLPNGGNDVMVGGLWSDTFIFKADDTGRQVIVDFEEWDTLDFSDFGYATKAEALADFHQVDNLAIYKNGDLSVVLRNVDVSDLTEDMILI
jgi:hypothetical protein